jgi:hypothetical protein
MSIDSRFPAALSRISASTSATALPPFGSASRRNVWETTVEVTASAARALDLLRNGAPRFASARAEKVRTGEMGVQGDLTPISRWTASHRQ